MNQLTICFFLLQGQQLHLYFMHTLFHDSGEVWVQSLWQALMRRYDCHTV